MGLSETPSEGVEHKHEMAGTGEHFSMDFQNEKRANSPDDHCNKAVVILTKCDAIKYLGIDRSVLLLPDGTIYSIPTSIWQDTNNLQSLMNFTSEVTGMHQIRCATVEKGDTLINISRNIQKLCDNVKRQVEFAIERLAGYKELMDSLLPASHYKRPSNNDTYSEQLRYTPYGKKEEPRRQVSLVDTSNLTLLANACCTINEK